MKETIHKQIAINAPAAAVWKVLTDTGTMKVWMGEPEMALEISSSREVGAPFVIRGFHHVQFENRGTILQYLPEELFSYNFLSSVSRLPDLPENHSVVRFALSPDEEGTILRLSLSVFPTDTIYQHLNFYWNGTLLKLKRAAEESAL